MINLRELYLRKNQISDPQQLYFLRNLTQLSVLWLQENPISSLPNYRRIVLKILPQLQTLDDVQVTHEERQEASVMDEEAVDDYTVPIHSPHSKTTESKRLDDVDFKLQFPSPRFSSMGASVTKQTPEEKPSWLKDQVKIK
jgi:hypothetical protein